jgi:putative transposase
MFAESFPSQTHRVLAMDWRLRSHRRRAYNEPGHAHALTFTCFRRYAFLQAERTCEWLGEEINQARAQLDFALWAYVFMPEHVHLLIYPRQACYDIAVILKAIKEPVGRRAVKLLREQSSPWLARIAVRHGKRLRYHFWQEGGGYDRNITEPNTVLSVIEYIHQNPVRRNLVTWAADWRWSSAGWYEGCKQTI